MIRFNQQTAETETRADGSAGEEHIAPVPRIFGAGFLRVDRDRGRSAGRRRRPANGQGAGTYPDGRDVRGAGGLPVFPDANVIVIESEKNTDGLLAALDELANVCDAESRVVVIGRFNDILLYRELIRRGVSDYVIAPIGAVDFVRSVQQPVLVTGRKGGRPGSRGCRRQGRGRRLRLLRTTYPGQSQKISALLLSLPISTLHSAPPDWISIRIPRRASQTRCSHLTGSTPHSSTVCCRNARIASASWLLPRRSIASMISAPKHSIRFSTRCARQSPVLCSTCRTSGPPGRDAY